MSKSLFIAEKPSVAKEFAKALKETFKSGDGFMESQSYVVTWCVGHLVAMRYMRLRKSTFRQVISFQKVRRIR